MKRLIVGMIAGLLMFAGLAAVSAESANAVCPYTGCVKTATQVRVTNAPVKQGQKARVCVRVITAGNGTPTGRVSIAVTRTNGGYKYFDSKNYRGGQTCFKTSSIQKRGRYIVLAKYQPGARTIFGASNNSTAFRVKRR